VVNRLNRRGLQKASLLLIKPMKSKWKLLPSNIIVDKLFNHKVCSVAETRVGNYIKWTGDLDSDEYFLLIVLDCVLTGAINERELLLPHGMYPLAYTSELDEVVKLPPTQFNKTAQMMFEKATSITNTMREMRFEDVMKVLKWKYVSENVEVYETNFV